MVRMQVLPQGHDAVPYVLRERFRFGGLVQRGERGLDPVLDF